MPPVRHRIGGFVLAAGEGRRLRPLTLVRPKALVPFCGVPLLELAVGRVASVEPVGIVVNAWYHAGQVARAVAGMRRRYGWPLHLSPEPQLLDTGGGLRHGAVHLPDAEHILVHNADVIADVDLERLIDVHLGSQAAVTAVLAPGRGPCTVDADGPELRIRDFRRPRGEGTFSFAGVHLLRREVLDLLPDDDVCSIIVAYERAMAAGHLVRGMPLAAHEYWEDLGTIPRYVAAHGQVADAPLQHHPRLRRAALGQQQRRARLQERGVTCTGSVGLGRRLQLPPGTRLHNVVAWDGTRVEAPGRYAEGILRGHVTLGTDALSNPCPDRRIYATLGCREGDCSVEFLGKQGSGRCYGRLRTPAGSWMWAAYSRDREENATFASAAAFLERLGIPVPQVRLHLPDAGQLVMEDLGGTSLLDLRNSAACQEHLETLAATAARLHVLGPAAVAREKPPLEEPFDLRLYHWERDYFRGKLLDAVLAGTELWNLAADAHDRLCRALLSSPPALVHRDFQSANVMVTDYGLRLIDFQGMRLGCAAYDLGSLLYDPYAAPSPEVRQALWRRYQEARQALGGDALPDELLPLAGIQRLLQALGAYGKLGYGDGLSWYRDYVRPGLRMLATAAAEAGSPEFGRLASRCLDILPAGHDGG